MPKKIPVVVVLHPDHTDGRAMVINYADYDSQKYKLPAEFKAQNEAVLAAAKAAAQAAQADSDAAEADAKRAKLLLDAAFSPEAALDADAVAAAAPKAVPPAKKAGKGK